MNIIIATIKSWNIKNSINFGDKNKDLSIHLISNKEDLSYEKIRQIGPKYIFFPHWSWIIPSKIYSNFTCIVFHMTDLPFGRGGSPVQNLIERGVENTKISAIKVDGGIDTGDIYIKEDLNLNSNAEEIFIRASNIIFNKMIPMIIKNELVPKPQNGEVTIFKRRNPEQSEICSSFDFKKIYDHIRMLDAENYPKAFVKFGKYRLEFSRASLKNDKILADVEIKEVTEDE
ncbi:formyltransferase family protein [Clostridiaceae bacterium M8S5]|nr:formyltransferase family protein [Clostridiaceae bacterium M8S5]